MYVDTVNSELNAISRLIRILDASRVNLIDFIKLALKVSMCRQFH